MADETLTEVVNKLFSVIDQKITKNKTIVAKVLANIDSLDGKSRAVIIPRLCAHLVDFKAAVDKYESDVMAVELAVDMLSTGLTPEEALSKLRADMEKIQINKVNNK